MVLHQNILQEIDHLWDGRPRQVRAIATPTALQYHPEHGVVQLRALVYQAEDFFPHGVKQVVLHARALMAAGFVARLTFCPRSNAVYLDATLESIKEKYFPGLFEDFLALADEWKHRLGEYDERDRVRVPVK